MMPNSDCSKAAALILTTLIALLTGCATDPLVAAAPHGVDLSGEWRLNVNLSDDPARMQEPTESAPKEPARSRDPGGFGRPGASGPGMRGGPGGLDPGGENLTDAARPSTGLTHVLYAQETTLPSSASDTNLRPMRASPRLLAAPELLSISQSGSKVVIKSMTDGTTEEYTAGEQRTVPFGQTEADRSSGWRDAAFVVITKAHKGPSKEDDFALDSEGHLIFATLLTHVKKGPIDFKRVYDRVRTPD